MESNLYLVLRSTGWPVNFPRYEFYDVIELSDDDAHDGVESGYLVPENAPKDHPIALTEEQVALFDAYREKQANERESQRLITNAAATHTPPSALGVATATAITEPVRDELLDKGFTADEINEMVPQQAHDALNRK